MIIDLGDHALVGRELDPRGSEMFDTIIVVG